jgi:hypothetical protein
MKKIFFAILAITFMSTSFAFAGKGKHAKRHMAKKVECPKDCPKTMSCAH